ncbi:ABC transporter permease [Clostridium tagluense]|uniref:ABC transporter permease n=1 Tax=Clostridium tagluense TaxID=360422 RepID=UPI001CF18667|nr:ABC transporter permease [Clostridium tagluense]MCB2311101.1 ABC transporter permease [Clostridium tagluense]MCB2318378.1 ABC transporter permease [Clostridium tagluense]MCB2323148.1 ABC transporter permease [Clostridium tagluense]MCB2325573.1 ABC transporter permease [Clostridium tagluense]MCB2332881.1 ABC transporter permease [Clostridium tagluense]
MRNIFLIAQNMFKIIFKKKSNIVVYILLPIVLVIVFMSLQGSSPDSKVSVGVINKDNTEIAADMLKYLDSTEKFKIVPINEENLEDKVSNGDVQFALIISENMKEKILKGNMENIQIISIKGQDATVWIENYIDMYMRNLMSISKAANGKEEVFNKIYKGYSKQELTLQSKVVTDNTKGRSSTQNTMGLFIMVMLMGTTTTSTLILKEKRERTYQRICTSTVSSKQYMTSNVIVNLFIVFIQITIVMFLATKILKYNMHVPTIQLLIILMSFGVVAVAIGLAIVAFAKSSASASNLSTLIITPSCMLGGCFWPVSMMPEYLQRLSDFIPQSWALGAIRKLQTGAQFKDILCNITILLGFALSFFLISVYKMKKDRNVERFI